LLIGSINRWQALDIAARVDLDSAGGF
jgi:hypothetical protein